MSDYIYLYDSTLRDGSQTFGVDFSTVDKQDIAHELDDIGIDYIEAGWPGSNPTDDAFFADLPKLTQACLTAFGMTRRNSTSVDNDPGLNTLINSGVKSVCIVGKSWDFHVTEALEITFEENLQMIAESIAYIKKKGCEPQFDAEHFFDGYKNNPEFALSCIKAAYENGARWVVLCDTNGGTLPHEIYQIVSEVTKHISGDNIGIHCHNDTGNAIANSLEAVRAGARQVQGTLNGLGERCGNTNLVTLIPTLELKMGYKTNVNKDKLKRLLHVSRFLDEKLNRQPDPFLPYVGSAAFAHKGGLHVSAVNKNPASYEHISPELVGNARNILISKQSGKSNILYRLKDIGIDSTKYPDSKISELVDDVKQLENRGFAYDSAGASFELLVLRKLQSVPNYFNLQSFRVIDERRWNSRDELVTVSEATAKMTIGGKHVMSVAEGNGPVNALDAVLRKALSDTYPILKDIKLIDYKVRIITPGSGTDAMIRVLIETTDKEGNRWSTVGASTNIIDASYSAMKDSITYKLIKTGHKHL